jgi:hypothetical protein
MDHKNCQQQHARLLRQRSRAVRHRAAGWGAAAATGARTLQPSSISFHCASAARPRLSRPRRHSSNTAPRSLARSSGAHLSDRQTDRHGSNGHPVPPKPPFGSGHGQGCAIRQTDRSPVSRAPCRWGTDRPRPSDRIDECAGCAPPPPQKKLMSLVQPLKKIDVVAGRPRELPDAWREPRSRCVARVPARACKDR